MDFVLPELGEGVQEGELIRWLVKEGDAVDVDQPLLEVMTDKATVEVPSTAKGIIKNLAGKEGDMLQVGQVLAVIDSGGAAVAKAPPPQPKPEAPKPQVSAAATRPSAPAAVSERPSPTTLPSPSPSPSPSIAPQRPVMSAAYQSPQELLNADQIPAAPVVRLMAQKAGVSLAEVPGTGPSVGGRARVLEQDLLSYLEARGAGSNGSIGGSSGKAFVAPAKPVPRQMPVSAAVSGGESEERRPLRGLRRVIAEAMVKSKFTIPHYAYVDEFECSDLVRFREQAKVSAEKYGVKFTYLPFIVKAVVAALKEFPEVNSVLEENNGQKELVLKKYYHIGFAVATENGLVVPVIRHADQKSLLDIAAEMQDLSARTRAGKAKPEELRGSTFSITSMGNIGGLFATPIINYPEVGIMGVYRVRDVPVVKNGMVVPGKVMNVSLSLDHRVVDGAVGGQFCNAIIERLANPARLMLELL